jgi:ATP-dependent Clp protease ATP-binding subunit ClpA
VDLARLLAGSPWEGEREKLFQTVLEEASESQSPIALDRLELPLMTVSLTPWLVASALDRGARLIATCLPALVEKLAQGPLARRVDVIELTEIPRDDSAAALRGLCQQLAAHHHLEIEPAVVEAAVERSLSLAGPLPDKAITLLDAAASRAGLLHQSSVTLCDVYLAASRMKEG